MLTQWAPQEGARAGSAGLQQPIPTPILTTSHRPKLGDDLLFSSPSEERVSRWLLRKPQQAFMDTQGRAPLPPTTLEVPRVPSASLVFLRPKCQEERRLRMVRYTVKVRAEMDLGIPVPISSRVKAHLKSFPFQTVSKSLQISVQTLHQELSECLGWRYMGRGHGRIVLLLS